MERELGHKRGESTLAEAGNREISSPKARSMRHTCRLTMVLQHSLGNGYSSISMKAAEVT